MKRPVAPAEASPHQRRAARRTAFFVAVVAALIYVAFVLSGVIGR
jgi:hypothetical protein